MMALRLFFKVPYYMIKIWWSGKSDKVSYEEAYRWCQYTTMKANKAGKVTIDCQGTEHLPQENGFILFPNHQGMFDMLAFLETCPVPFSFVIKKEASEVILLKQVIEATESLSIDRKDLRQSMDVIKTMTKKVGEGRNFLIFAEGTRSREENKILEFKSGSFKSAVKAKCPIVPCALIDAFKPFDEKSIKPVTVKIRYLEPIYYEEYKDMSTTEIASEVQRRIKETIEREIEITPT